MKPFPFLSIEPWGGAYLSKDHRVQEFLASSINCVEVLLHTSFPSVQAGAEFFVRDSQNMKVADVLAMAELYDHYVILNVDGHHGNGRTTSQSPVLPGWYQRGLHEGGVIEAVASALRIADNMPRVIGIQLFNEQSRRVPPDWYIERARVVRKMIDRFNEGHPKREEPLRLILGGKVEEVLPALQYAHYFDPHFVFTSDPLRMLETLDDVHAEYKVPYVVSELTPPTGKMFYEDLLGAFLSRAYVHGVSCFVGDTVLPFEKRTKWNFRYLEPFTAWTKHGKTWIGDIYEDAVSEWLEIGEPVPVPPAQPEQLRVGRKQLENWIDLTSEIKRSIEHDRLATAMRQLARLQVRMSSVYERETGDEYNPD